MTLLLGPAFDEQTPESFAEYLTTLVLKHKPRKSPKKKAEFKPVLINRNKKGSVVIRIRRDPKVLLFTEMQQAAVDLEMDLQELAELVKKRKITVKEKIEDKISVDVMASPF